MYDTKLRSFILDDEIKNLFPPLNTDQLVKIEENIIYHGCPRPLLVWRNILLTDYAYYDIYKKWNIPFSVTELNFATRDDAMVTVCKYIIKYYELPDIYYRYAIGKCFLAIKNIMSDVFAHRRESPFNPVSEEDLGKANKSVSAAITAKMFYISSGTASQYGTYATALDNIRRYKPEIAEKIFAKEYSLSIQNIISMGKMSTNEIQIIYDYTKNKKETGPIFLEIKKKLDLQKSYSEVKGRGRRPSHPEIKQMPKYDPDSEVSSLSLTIPMWISSINRTISLAKFDQVTPSALKNLDSKLTALYGAIKSLQNIIKETCHE